VNSHQQPNPQYEVPHKPEAEILKGFRSRLVWTYIYLKRSTSH